MHLLPVLLLSTAALSSARIPRRDVPFNPLFSDLKTVNTDANTFTQQVNAYNGTSPSATAVDNAATNLENALKSATTDTKASSGLSNSDGQNVADYVNATLGPDLTAACKAVIAKKQAWAAHGLTSVAKEYVTDLKADVDTYFAALESKVPTAAQQSVIKAAGAKVDSACNSSSLS